MRGLAMRAVLVLAYAILVAGDHFRDSFISKIPDLAEGVELPEMHSGSIEINKETRASLWYWRVQATFRVTKKRKTIFWFNGGPGCSSMDGALLELGPLRIKGDGKLHFNAGHWATYVDIVFVDQPVGVGYSSPGTGEYTHELDQAGHNVAVFLQEYFKLYPDSEKGDVYLAGESYAGQYIPYIYNATQTFDLPEIKGLLLMSPWLNGPIQYLSYVEFARSHGLFEGDEKSNSRLNALHENCIDHLQSVEISLPHDNDCELMINYILKHSAESGRCVNIYDISQTDNFPSCGMNWPEGVEHLSEYLSRQNVKDAFHAGTSASWKECNTQVQHSFTANKLVNSVKLLPAILEKVPVMIVGAGRDFICNTKGLKSTVDQLIWGGSSRPGFTPSEQDETLLFQNQTVGSLRQGRGLTLATLDNATHMIPVDHQFESLMLMHEFVGITKEFKNNFDIDMPAPALAPEPAPVPAPAPAPVLASGVSMSELNAEVRKAYFVSFIALIVIVAILSMALIVFVTLRAEKRLSFGGLKRAILQLVWPPKQQRYIPLETLEFDR